MGHFRRKRGADVADNTADDTNIEGLPDMIQERSSFDSFDRDPCNSVCLAEVRVSLLVIEDWTIWVPQISEKLV